MSVRVSYVGACYHMQGLFLSHNRNKEKALCEFSLAVVGRHKIVCIFIDINVIAL